MTGSGGSSAAVWPALSEFNDPTARPDPPYRIGTSSGTRVFASSPSSAVCRVALRTSVLEQATSLVLLSRALRRAPPRPCGSRQDRRCASLRWLWKQSPVWPVTYPRTSRPPTLASAFRSRAPPPSSHSWLLCHTPNPASPASPRWSRNVAGTPRRDAAGALPCLRRNEPCWVEPSAGMAQRATSFGNEG